MSGFLEKFNFFDTTTLSCKEGDFLFSTDTEGNGGEPEVVIFVTQDEFSSYCPTSDTEIRRKWAQWPTAKLRVASPDEKAKMIGHYLTMLAIDQTRIDVKRNFWANLSLGELSFSSFFMVKK
jgi:hypothetical protein